MPRKTAEERKREYDDAKAKRSKGLVCKGVTVPEVHNLHTRTKVERNHEATGQYRIYCLVDPRDYKPFYVGRTTIGEQARLHLHEKDARRPRC